MKVDIIVDETFAIDPTAYNISSFLTSLNISSSDNYTFLSNKTVYRYDKSTRTIAPSVVLKIPAQGLASQESEVGGVAMMLYM